MAYTPDPARERPRWVRELSLFLMDTIIDYIDPDGADDDITDDIYRAAMAIVCDEYGHYVEDDHCGIPGHRYCEVCSRPMPDLPLGQYFGPPPVLAPAHQLTLF